MQIPSKLICPQLPWQWSDLLARWITLVLQVSFQILGIQKRFSNGFLQGGSQTCDEGANYSGNIHAGRFCGKYFSSVVLGAETNSPVCSKSIIFSHPEFCVNFESFFQLAALLLVSSFTLMTTLLLSLKALRKEESVWTMYKFLAVHKKAFL